MNRKTVSMVGRPRKSGEILSVERPVKWAPSVYDKIVARSEKTGASIAEVIRRAVMKDLEQESADLPKPNEITFELNDVDQTALTKLADDLRLDDPNQFAKSVIRHAIDYGPDLMREFISGQLDQTLAESKPKSRLMQRVEEEVEKEKAEIAARKTRATKSTKEQKAA